MSTLVKFLLAIVLQVLHVGEMPVMTSAEQNKEQVIQKLGPQQLNPHYVVTREELLSHLNERTL